MKLLLKVDMPSLKTIPVSILIEVTKEGYRTRYKWGTYVTKKGEVFFETASVMEFPNLKQVLCYINKETIKMKKFMKQVTIEPSKNTKLIHL